MLLPPPPLDSPPPDPFLSLHGEPSSRTLVFIAATVVAGMLLANIPGQIVGAPDVFSDGKYGPHFETGKTCHHGWPFSFLVREPTWTRSSGCELSPWNLTKGIVSWSWSALAGDFLVGLLSLPLACFAFRWWRHRRWHVLQVRLDEIMFAFLLVAIGLGWWAWNRDQRNRQEHSLEQLQQRHPDFWKGYEAEWTLGGPTWLRRLMGDRVFSAFDRVTGLDVPGEDLMLPCLADLRSIRRIRVSGSVSNVQLEALRQFPELEGLDLLWANIANDDERGATVTPWLCLPRLPGLRGLNLWEAPFRGDGLEQLTSIEVLDLTGTEVGDDAMLKLEKLRNLKVLFVAGTNITDACLLHLSGLEKLERFNVGNAAVTEEGLKKLQRALPKCKIER